MKVYLISQPVMMFGEFIQFCHDEGCIQPVGQESHAELVCEQAGRICYMSYGKGRKTNHEFLSNIIDSGHHSVLEHANYTLFITGISRSCSHELVRHRHLSFSQLSQRYIDESGAEMIIPPAVNMAGSSDVFYRAVETARTAYRVLVGNLELLFKDIPNPTDRRKAARQAARSVLPNATETKIAVTGNARAWRQFIELRSSVHADPEIRALAIMIYEKLRDTSPNLFSGLKVEPV